MIGELLPAPTMAAEAFGDPATPAALFPEEERVVARAVAKRRQEFATVRACARAALGRLGVAPAPLLPGPHGAPLWPEGIVGSMTHCRGYRAAAVARGSDMVTIGLDAEPNEPLPGDGVLELVTLPEERAALPRLAAERPEVCWDRLLFSVKESVYKAWYPLTGRWLDFGEASVTVDPSAGTFSARLLVPGPVVHGTRMPGFHGRWMLRHGLLVTAIAVGSASLGPVDGPPAEAAAAGRCSGAEPGRAGA